MATHSNEMNSKLFKFFKNWHVILFYLCFTVFILQLQTTVFVSMEQLKGIYSIEINIIKVWLLKPISVYFHDIKDVFFALLCIYETCPDMLNTGLG